jgi:hypothetical protein
MTAAASAGRPYLLDTSVILHLVRGKALGQQIQETYDLIHCQPRSLTIVNINHPSVIDAYVQLDLHARAHPQGARTMGKNDLLTTDKDFVFLIPTPVQGHVIASA